MHRSIVGNLRQTKQTKQDEKRVVLQLQIYFFFCNSIVITLLSNIMYLLFLLWLTQKALKMIDVELLMKNDFKFSLSIMDSPYGGHYRYLNVYLDSSVLGFRFFFIFIRVCSLYIFIGVDNLFHRRNTYFWLLLIWKGCWFRKWSHPHKNQP